LAGFLTWIEQALLHGYQRAGFAKASVHVTANREARRVHARITEGQRFWCGAVRISGLNDEFTARLRERLGQLSLGLQSGEEWLWRVGGWVLRANDRVWPRGSWPWAIRRDATCFLAGKPGLAATELEALARAEDTGPLACLVAARVFGRFDPRLAVPFARQGAARTTPDALLADLGTLFGEETTGGEVLRRILTCSEFWQREELQGLEPVWGAETLPALRPRSLAFRTDP
jgi:hypothetical protein